MKMIILMQNTKKDFISFLKMFMEKKIYVNGEKEYKKQILEKNENLALFVNE